MQISGLFLAMNMLFLPRMFSSATENEGKVHLLVHQKYCLIMLISTGVHWGTYTSSMLWYIIRISRKFVFQCVVYNYVGNFSLLSLS